MKLVWLAVALAILPNIAFTQNNTNSPYTRYGYGSLADKAFTSQRAMGGIGYGVRSPYMINPMNPASYSGIDSLTFMFDLGAMTQFAWFDDGTHKERKLNGNLEYIGLQFPLVKKMGFGVGLEPVSYVGYRYGLTEVRESGLISRSEYIGTGGLSKVYGSLSYDLFSHLSLGVKVGYLYGDIIRSEYESVSEASALTASKTDTLRSTGLTYDLGLQYHQSVGKNKTLVVGLVYSPKLRVHGGVKLGLFSSSSQNYSTNDTVFEMPESYGLGFTFNKLYHYTFGADVLYQRWADAKFYDQTGALNNRLKVNLGGEYIPNLMTNKYYNRIRYRAGLNYTDSYIKFRDTGYKEYGASVGLGLPMVDRRSFVNLAFEYSLIRPNVKSYTKEQYFKLTLSYTFNELWFFKQKLQ